MRFHWQSLNDGKIKKRELHGRCWIGSYKHSVDIEWHFPDWWRCGFGFTVNSGDSNNRLSFNLQAILFSIYVSIPFFRFNIGHWSKYREQKFFIHEERDFRIYLHAGGLWIFPWRNPMEWNKSDPWYMQTYHFDPADFFLGQRKYERKILTVGECWIPMPEGSYSANYEETIETWIRPRWPLKKTRYGFWFEIPGGIPHEGKGENSWDCGEDALCGTGSSKPTLPEAIGDVTGCALRYRERYGRRDLMHRDLGMVVRNERRIAYESQRNGETKCQSENPKAS